MPIIHPPKRQNGATKDFHAPTDQPTPTEMSERWPTTPPENLTLIPGRWVDRELAAKLIGDANGATHPDQGASWLQVLIRLGRVDVRGDVRGSEVRLLPENELGGSPRVGSPEAFAEEARLSRLRTDLASLGMRAVPVDPA
jgi:hypothetical protein